MDASFGRLLRDHRLAAGLTQEELASRAGLSVRAVSDMERGRTTRPYPRSVRLLATALGLGAADAGRLAGATTAANMATAPGPRQLPAPVRDFVGRAVELRRLDGLLDDMAAGPVVAAVSGTAGAGKTALALHWAYRHADYFPDGQLYVDLRGYDPDRPVRAEEALAGFLRALGVSGRHLPSGLDERAARYRSLLSGRRVLVVVDNARDADEVRPLLPGSSTCATIVTSRASLGGLVARDGSRRLDLDVLPERDAVTLLCLLVGERARDDPAATTALAGHCSRLPLALRLVAEHAAHRAATPLRDLAEELVDLRRRLDVLDGTDDVRTAVRGVFSWSYRQLEPAVARAFRLLGLHPGTEFDAHAAAALAGSTVGSAHSALEHLSRVHLVHRVGADRYGLHDLLRAYAGELAAAEEDEDVTAKAATRLADHYLHAATEAMNVLVPAERHRRPVVAAGPVPAPPMPDRDAARRWLLAESANLVVIAEWSADHGRPSHTPRLATTLFRFFDISGLHAEAIAVHNAALRAARQLGDAAAEATALVNLGVVDIWQGRHDRATARFEQAVALCDGADPAVRSRALHNLGVVDLQQHRYPAAAEHLTEALELSRQTEDLTSEANALINLGIADMRRDQLEHAAEHFDQVLALCRQTGDRTSEANVLVNVGELLLRQGRYSDAADRIRAAMAICRSIDDLVDEAYALIYLGLIESRTGRRRQALECLRKALALTRKLGDRTGEVEALNGLGEIHLAAGRTTEAHAQYTAGLVLATAIGDRYEQARAHSGLAQLELTPGSVPKTAAGTASHHDAAQRLYAAIGLPPPTL